MVDTWQPAAHIDNISTEKLAQLAAIINNDLSVNDALKQIVDNDITLIASSLNTPKDQWIQAIEPLSTEQILALCRVFTIGEMEFPSWTFGSKNPTIYCLKYLKSKKITVEKDFIRWLKKNTDNRYIPYGPAL